MVDQDYSCVQPAGGPVDPTGDQSASPTNSLEEMEVPKMIAKVGKTAPDFEANAYINGGFKTIKLSDYKGQWVVLCFYPGDFTFV